MNICLILDTGAGIEDHDSDRKHNNADLFPDVTMNSWNAVVCRLAATLYTFNALSLLRRVCS